MRRFGVFLLFLLFCSLSTFAVDYKGLVINELLAGNASIQIETPSYNFLNWIEIYNTSNQSIDIKNCYFSDDAKNPKKSKVSNSLIIKPKEFKLLWCDAQRVQNHTGILLNMQGGFIGLYNPSGQRIDEVNYDAQLTDISYGRKPDGNGEWYYFSEPSPEKSNTQDGAAKKKRTDAPVFSLGSGIYKGTQPLKLSVKSSTAVIMYTTDGSIPVASSILYERPFTLSAPRVIRARAFEKGKIASPVISHTFIINATHTIPIVSISTNPAYLTDKMIGIYVAGRNGITGNCSNGKVNWNQDWERPVSMEYFMPDGQRELQVEAGIKIFGACSRGNAQKSFAIYADDKYGENRIRYPFFANKPIREFKSLVLRNSGNDNNSTLFRDAFMEGIVLNQMDIDCADSQAVSVYLNGDYWGIYTLKEKINEHYIEDNHGYDSDALDLLENNAIVLSGNNTQYNRFLSTLKINDPSKPEFLDTIKKQIDTEEYLNYQIAQIYFANTDWPGNNIRYWRPQIPDGRWRWIMYDTDFGFGLQGNYSTNTLSMALSAKGPTWPNPSWSTYVFRRLMENTQFREDFIQRFMSCFTLVFNAPRVSALADQYEGEMAGDMPKHILRWKSPTTINTWRSNVKTLRTFAGKRQSFVEKFIKTQFKLGDLTGVHLEVADHGKGTIYVNSIPQTETVASATFFDQIPIRCHAIPKSGYRFARWDGQSEEAKDKIQILPQKEGLVKAIFEKGNAIVIREILYNPSRAQGGEKGQYIKLYNAGNASVDLSGYSFSKPIKFTFPEHAEILPYGAVIVAAEKDLHPHSIHPVYEWMEGKLSGEGQEIQLKDCYKNIVFSFRFGVFSPWPEVAEGYSITLWDPNKDPNKPENWIITFPFFSKKVLPGINDWNSY